VWELLVVPTVQPPKVSEAGDMVNGRMAVPVAFNTSGFTAVLFVSVIAPSSDPVVDGVKVTVNVQEAPDNKVVTQPDAL
jgi:hypothetical protein